VAEWTTTDGSTLLGYRAADACWAVVEGLGAYRFRRGGDVDAIPERELPHRDLQDAYRRSVLPLVLQARGVEVLHASAVALREGVVALCGTSTTGKSTLAWALGQRGYEIVADDALAVSLNGGGALALTLPFRLRLRPDARLCAGGDTVREGAGGAEEPLRALVMLERGGAGPVTRLVPIDAFATLLPHAYCFSLEDEARKKALVSVYLNLVQAIPVVRFPFADGLDRLDEAVDALEGVFAGV
jgi:hypothetical protein